MTKLYRVSDRVPVKLDGLVVKISPLKYDQKAEMQTMLLDGTPLSMVKAAQYAVKCCVKDVDGLELQDGSKYELEFENDMLTDDCVSDLFNIPQSEKLAFICTELLQGIPANQFVDPKTGKKLEGVTIVRSKSPAKKK